VSAAVNGENKDTGRIPVQTLRHPQFRVEAGALGIMQKIFNRFIKRPLVTGMSRLRIDPRGFIDRQQIRVSIKKMALAEHTRLERQTPQVTSSGTASPYGTGAAATAAAGDMHPAEIEDLACMGTRKIVDACGQKLIDSHPVIIIGNNETIKATKIASQNKILPHQKKEHQRLTTSSSVISINVQTFFEIVSGMRENLFAAATNISRNNDRTQGHGEPARHAAGRLKCPFG